jgi:NADPH:quinone reductase-like Zn-dependent oxidoreductase
VSNASTLVAELSPDKQAELFQKLKARNGGTAQRAAQQYRTMTIGDGENFRLALTSPGNPESLRPVAIPRQPPGPGEVEVEIHACSLNFRDLMLILGMYPAVSGNPSNTMGLDWSGRVVAVGEGVKRLQPGDEVIGLFPADFSPYVTCHHSRVVNKPKGLGFEQASALPTVFLTCFNTLHTRGRLGRGERVLIHSAAGGVGVAGIQVAHWLGAEVFATAGNEEKRAFVRRLGVHHVFDSRTLHWADQIMEATNGEGVDLVLNSLTGEAIPKGISVLREHGRFIEIGMRDLYSDATIPLRPFARSLSFIATGALGRVELPQALDEIVALFDQGVFTVPPNKVYPFGEISAALSFLSQGVHIGKITLQMHGQQVNVAV